MYSICSGLKGRGLWGNGISKELGSSYICFSIEIKLVMSKFWKFCICAMFRNFKRYSKVGFESIQQFLPPDSSGKQTFTWTSALLNIVTATQNKLGEVSYPYDCNYYHNMIQKWTSAYRIHADSWITWWKSNDKWICCWGLVKHYGMSILFPTQTCVFNSHMCDNLQKLHNNHTSVLETPRFVIQLLSGNSM